MANNQKIVDAVINTVMADLLVVLIEKGYEFDERKVILSALQLELKNDYKYLLTKVGKL